MLASCSPIDLGGWLDLCSSLPPIDWVADDLGDPATPSWAGGGMAGSPVFANWSTPPLERLGEGSGPWHRAVGLAPAGAC